MIHSREINAVASKQKLKDSQIEKDYILTWILFGIANNFLLSKILVFKGGTVLKKVYFNDYRYSEDLDFTLLNEEISNNEILKVFEQVYSFIKEEANITVQFKDSDIHKGSGSLVFYLNYTGPLMGDIKSRDIKIDITRGEKLEFEIKTLEIFKSYSDIPESSFLIQCYSLSEVLIEKMVALMGRTQPRDLYDFWYLTMIEKLSTKDHKIHFESKAKNKKLVPAKFQEVVLTKEYNFKKSWQNNLANQIDELPKFEDVFREIKRSLKI